MRALWHPPEMDVVTCPLDWRVSPSSNIVIRDLCGPPTIITEEEKKKKKDTGFSPDPDCKNPHPDPSVLFAFIYEKITIKI